MENAMSVTEAARYLGITRRALQYHIYTTRRLRPDVQLGNRLGFYRDTLDRFAEQSRAASGYTIPEAASYLGLSVNQVRYHIWGTGKLQEDRRRGKTLIFDRATLDKFRELELGE